jgi:hypothetical protein
MTGLDEPGDIAADKGPPVMFCEKGMRCYALVLSLCHASIFFVRLSHLSHHVYYRPAFSAFTGLTSDLAVISILSSYVPIMHHVTHFPFLYRHSHAYVSFLLMTLYDSSPLYIPRATQFSTD